VSDVCRRWSWERACVSILWVLLCAWLISCGGDSDDGANGPGADEALAAGWAAYELGDYATAASEFGRAVGLDSGLADAHNGLGWSQLSLSTGAPTRAGLDSSVASFGQALQEDNQLADAWVGIGHTLFLRRSESSDFVDAAKALESALSADPASLYRHDYTPASKVHAAQAWSYYYAGDLTAARRGADEALALEPDLGAALVLQSLTP